MLSPDYELCQTGTQQAPIPLNFQQGLSTAHLLRFNYTGDIPGSFYNWGYGPAFSLTKAPCTTGSTAADCPVDLNAPHFTFDENGIDETVYLVSWHVHTPADHSVQGDRSKAELHLVHVDKNGRERAVLAIRIDPGVSSYSSFFAQALREVGDFKEMWTYRGSLTSPPCREGIRFFIARNILFVSNAQMQDILRVSTYSARAEQEVWMHEINV